MRLGFSPLWRHVDTPRLRKQPLFTGLLLVAECWGELINQVWIIQSLFLVHIAHCLRRGPVATSTKNERNGASHPVNQSNAPESLCPANTQGQYCCKGTHHPGHCAYSYRELFNQKDLTLSDFIIDCVNFGLYGDGADVVLLSQTALQAFQNLILERQQTKSHWSHLHSNAARTSRAINTSWIQRCCHDKLVEVFPAASLILLAWRDRTFLYNIRRCVKIILHRFDRFNRFAFLLHTQEWIILTPKRTKTWLTAFSSLRFLWDQD